MNDDEKLNDFLDHHEIVWKFNLSRAPSWGGQFERMVGLVKAAIRKTTGNVSHAFNGLKEVILDLEVALNGRPLPYVKEDLQLPILTPNSLMCIRPNVVTERHQHHEENSGNARNTCVNPRRPCRDNGPMSTFVFAKVA